MDLWTLATSFALLWILCFIDGKAVLELRLFFHDLTKATCHLYLALLPLRRATIHFAKCIRHLVQLALQSPSPHSDSTDCARHLFSHVKQSSSPHTSLRDQPLAKEGMLHFLEGLCVVCEMVPNLMGAALSVGAAFCHILQGGFYILAATLRTIQVNLFSQMNGEKERWDKERLRAKEEEKNQFQHAGVHHGVPSGPCQCFLKQGRRATCG